MVRNILSIVLLTLTLITSAQTPFNQTGIASFYAAKFEGNYTASGEKYLPQNYTAAHLSLKFGTHVKITNLENGKSVVVKINDRGPFVPGRIIDLSLAAAQAIDMVEKGTVKVSIQVTTEKVPVPINANQLPSTPNNQFILPDAENVIETPLEVSSNIIIPSTGTETYKLSVNSLSAEGYGVQLGSFQESANFLRTASEFSQKFGNNLYIQVVKKDDNTKIYKLILGKYNERKEAEQLKRKLKGEYPGVFVISY